MKPRKGQGLQEKSSTPELSQNCHRYCSGQELGCPIPIDAWIITLEGRQMLKGQNSNFRGFATYQLIWVREMPLLLILMSLISEAHEAHELAFPHCQLKAGTWTRLFLPLERWLQVFSSQLEKELGLQTQAHKYATGMCDQVVFLTLHGRKGARLNQPSLKICLQVLKVFRASQLLTISASDSENNHTAWNSSTCYADSTGNCRFKAAFHWDPSQNILRHQLHLNFSYS